MNCKWIEVECSFSFRVIPCDHLPEPNHLQLINSGVPNLSAVVSIPYYRSALTGKLVNCFEFNILEHAIGKVSGRNETRWVNFLDDRIPRYRTIVIYLALLSSLGFTISVFGLLLTLRKICEICGGCAPVVYLIWLGLLAWGEGRLVTWLRSTVLYSAYVASCDLSLLLVSSDLQAVLPFSTPHPYCYIV